MVFEMSIAPCGVNCSVCYAHLRSRNKCSGCWGDDKVKPKHCKVCSIKNCEYLANSGSRYCFGCEKYPCARLKRLDKNYRQKYQISLIGNLEQIRISGIHSFMVNENEKWSCKCGGFICEHTGKCIVCGVSK